MKQQDKDDFIKSVITTATPCNCHCHSKSAGKVMHMFPCCDRTYEKFNK